MVTIHNTKGEKQLLSMLEIERALLQLVSEGRFVIVNPALPGFEGTVRRLDAVVGGTDILYLEVGFVERGGKHS